MIHRKKNDLLYKYTTCLCHSLARLWTLFLVVLFLLGLWLRLAPLCVGPLLCGSVSVRTRFCSLICSGCFFSLVLGFLPLCRFFLKVLFFTALVGATCFHWMLLLSLFLRPSSFLFYCCRNIVGPLSLLIVSVLGFRCGLPFYPGPHNSGTVDFVFQYGYLLCSECTSSVMFYAFFYLGLLVSGFVLFHILCGSFSSDCFSRHRRCVTACDKVIESLVNRW